MMLATMTIMMMTMPMPMPITLMIMVLKDGDPNVYLCELHINTITCVSYIRLWLRCTGLLAFCGTSTVLLVVTISLQSKLIYCMLHLVTRDL